MDYKTAIKNAKHLKAIGQTEIYLDEKKLTDLPWHLAASCEEGGSHRLDMSTSIWFRGTDKKTGLKFRWSFDIEPYSANGKGHYELDVASCRKVAQMLAPAASKMFAAYLKGCADKVLAKGREWQAIADRQMADGVTLKLLTQDCFAPNGDTKP